MSVDIHSFDDNDLDRFVDKIVDNLVTSNKLSSLLRKSIEELFPVTQIQSPNSQCNHEYGEWSIEMTNRWTRYYGRRCSKCDIIDRWDCAKNKHIFHRIITDYEFSYTIACNDHCINCDYIEYIS
jgi:hypothetical protein